MEGESPKILTLPNMVAGTVAFFVSVLGVRVTYPMVDAILGLMSTGVEKAAATFIMWLIYFFVVFAIVWIRFTGAVRSDDI